LTYPLRPQWIRHPVTGSILLHYETIAEHSGGTPASKPWKTLLTNWTSSSGSSASPFRRKAEGAKANSRQPKRKGG